MSDFETALQAVQTAHVAEVSKLNTQLTDAELAKESLAAANTQLDAAKAELTAIREHLNDTPNDIRTAELEGQLASLTAERDSAQRNLDSANNRIRRRDATISDLQAALAKK